MSIFLGLGSNEGDRRQHLERAINELKRAGFDVQTVSPLVESPAMLPDGAESSWNKPYLNCVVEGTSNYSPLEFLSIAKSIEAKLGRVPSKRWSPRPIDIDILLWDELTMATDVLTIPHVGVVNRDFVLSPLSAIRPNLVVPGTQSTVFELSRKTSVIPLWMGILNLTPDSFSDGNAWSEEKKLIEHLDELEQHHVQILDVGAESTRPGAETISLDEEWRRLNPVLELLADRRQGKVLRPKISLDSRNFVTMEKAMDYGVDIINDVTGLSDPRVVELVKNSDIQVVTMHSTVVPADPKCLMSTEEPVVNQLIDWLFRKADGWLDAGIRPEQIIFDPGVGFGKNVLQTLDLLKSIGQLREAGFRLLIGHSRKSFMRGFSGSDKQERDMATLGMSLALCQQGVDIIRVHDPVIHANAYRAWSHISRAN